MNKVSIIAHQKYVEDIVYRLHEIGLMEIKIISEIEELEKTNEHPDTQICIDYETRLTRIIDILRHKTLEISKRYFKESESNTPSDIKRNCMRKDFSPTYYDTPANRTCLKFASIKFNSKFLYVYKNQISNKDTYAGIYIAMFTDNHFNYSNSIKLAVCRT